ncbi:hypothetical protein BZG36_02950 [Bifiguratus adelaidae]|uniref:Uncharacterized protein n=1 Tax=Bifiguratus adelaidae TaxID=1938954 RepID=A0A261Y0V0_9FUNG|nr:hypothetical protein BZG36_02950 [Bifiguratus adelaidae]
MSSKLRSLQRVRTKRSSERAQAAPKALLIEMPDPPSLEPERLIQGRLFLLKLRRITFGLFEGWDDDMCCFSVLREDSGPLRWSAARYVPLTFNAYPSFDSFGNPLLDLWQHILKKPLPENWRRLVDESRRREAFWWEFQTLRGKDALQGSKDDYQQLMSHWTSVYTPPVESSNARLQYLAPRAIPGARASKEDLSEDPDGFIKEAATQTHISQEQGDTSDADPHTPPLTMSPYSPQSSPSPVYEQLPLSLASPSISLDKAPYFPYSYNSPIFFHEKELVEDEVDSHTPLNDHYDHNSPSWTDQQLHHRSPLMPNALSNPYKGLSRMRSLTRWLSTSSTRSRTKRTSFDMPTYSQQSPIVIN